MEVKRRHLKRSAPDSVRRLARFLHLHGIDEMSDRHVVKLVSWLLSRREKRERNLIS